MNIAILGAGNVAWHISKAFIKAGHPVKQIWNRDNQKAVELALEIGANSIDDLSLISERIDIVVLAISDDAITDTAAKLSLLSHQTLVHTSGSTHIAVLKDHAENYGVIYPLQTFSRFANLDFTQTPLFIEGNNESTTASLLQLTQSISEKVENISSEQRIKLHIAAVFACNFTNHFYTIAQNVLFSSGLNFELLRPLIENTIQQALQGSPYELQTGPARRNDIVTMQRHLELLANQPNLQYLYETVSQHIVKMYSINQSQHK